MTPVVSSGVKILIFGTKVVAAASVIPIIYGGGALMFGLGKVGDLLGLIGSIVRRADYGVASILNGSADAIDTFTNALLIDVFARDVDFHFNADTVAMLTFHGRGVLAARKLLREQ